MTARLKASTVMRTFEERVILQAHQEQTVVLELQVRLTLRFGCLLVARLLLTNEVGLVDGMLVRGVM